MIKEKIIVNLKIEIEAFQSETENKQKYAWDGSHWEGDF